MTRTPGHCPFIGLKEGPVRLRRHILRTPDRKQTAHFPNGRLINEPALAGRDTEDVYVARPRICRSDKAHPPHPLNPYRVKRSNFPSSESRRHRR